MSLKLTSMNYIMILILHCLLTSTYSNIKSYTVYIYYYYYSNIRINSIIYIYGNTTIFTITFIYICIWKHYLHLQCIYKIHKLIFIYTETLQYLLVHLYIYIYIYIYMNICVNVFKVNKHELYNDFNFSYFHCF